MKSISKAFPYRITVAFTLVFGLVACGGGGGNTGVTSPPPSIYDNSVTNLNVPIPLPLPSYPVGSAEMGGWKVLQTARILCGFGKLTQNTQLDGAAFAHANYMTSESVRLNSTVMGHDEPNTSNAFFTGNDGLIRAQYQGYGRYNYVAIAEILASTTWPNNFGNLPTMEQSGGNAMRDLLNTVYHLSGAMYDGPDIGFGAAQQTTPYGVEFRFGSLNGYQSLTPRLPLNPGPLATYPCDGSSNIPSAFIFRNESPNPFPNMPLTTQKVGPPIYVKVDAGQTLVVDATLSTISIGGANVATTLMTRDNDPASPKMIGINEAFLIPTQPLSPNSNYLVTLNGTINSARFQTRTFTMRTGT